MRTTYKPEAQVLKLRFLYPPPKNLGQYAASITEISPRELRILRDLYKSATSKLALQACVAVGQVSKGPPSKMAEIGDLGAHAEVVAGQRLMDFLQENTRLRQMYSFAAASNSANGIRNMLSLAKSEPGIAVAHGQLDTNAMLLV